jgi:restriction endonuclease Mrr
LLIGLSDRSTQRPAVTERCTSGLPRPKSLSFLIQRSSEKDVRRVAASPDDRLEAAVAELRATTTAELLETLAQVSPKFFETIVLDVLHKLGYGTSRGDLARVGRSVWLGQYDMATRLTINRPTQAGGALGRAGCR